MRYRIQIQPMMGAVVCVVATYQDLGSVDRITSKLYTIDAQDVATDDIIEILGQLQRLIGETTP